MKLFRAIRNKQTNGNLHRMVLSYASILLIAVLIILLSLGAYAAVWPKAAGEKVKKDGSLKVDCSNCNKGYVFAKASKSKAKLKLRVSKGDDVLTYDINQEGNAEVYPLQLGDGKYTVSLYKNVKGKQYAADGEVSFKVSLKNEESPFLYPNQYVYYTASYDAVAKAQSLCEGLTSRKDKFKAICKFMEQNFVYDFVRAVTVKTGQLPDIENCYKQKMGICQDLAAVMVCMLRSQDVPSKLVIGYADSNYHAWTLTYMDDGEQVFYDPTVAVNGIGKPKEYTTERFY